MPQVIPPTPRPIKTDIELFARAYFNIELTSYQMEIIALVASGKPIGDIHSLPPRPAKLKGVTQAGKILNAIKQPGGAYNWQLSRIALKYTSVISDLRKDGHDIEAVRQYNKKGKATDTWLYLCHD